MVSNMVRLSKKLGAGNYEKMVHNGIEYGKIK